MGAAVPQVVTESSASGAQVIDGSLYFNGGTGNDGNDTYLTKTPSSAGNQRTFTVSIWLKRTQLSNSVDAYVWESHNNPENAGVLFEQAGQIVFRGYASDFVWRLQTTRVFRDLGWYHVVFVYDSTDSTSTDRLRLYVNGVRETAFDHATYPSENHQTGWNNNVAQYIGAYRNPSNHYDGHMSQFYNIDGQALGPENFGYTDPLTNTWRPKKYDIEPPTVQTIQPTYVNSSSVLDPTNAFDGSSGTEATYSGVGSWISFTVTDASNLSVPFEIRNDSSGTGQSVAMFTDSGGSSAVSGSWSSTGNNTLSPAISTTVNDTYTFPSTGTYYLRHTVGSDSNIFVYKIGGTVTTGGNSFYLPMDGNLPIGEDKSGNGNNWTPVNFGGSVALPKATGALPILNTDGGGNVARVGVRTDINYSNLVLALPLVGNKEDVSNSVNSGSTTKTITASNTTHSSSQSNFYGGSIYFDNTADEYLSFPGATFSGEFCVEFWYYPDALATNNGTVTVMLSGDAIDQFQIAHTSSNGIEIYFDGSLRAQSGAISLDRWYHIAFTRDSSNVLKLYVDGIQKGSTPTVSTSEAVTTFYLGVQYRSGDADYHRTNGYIQDFRIYNGTVKYSSDFVVPATSPDILPDTPSGVSGSSKLAKVTDGAVSIPDSNSRLSLADSDDAFNLGSGDWTIEAFVYLDNVGGDANVVFFQGYTSDYLSSQDRMIVSYITTGGIINIAQSTTGTDNHDEGYGNTPLGNNRWYHLAYVRNGSNLDVYVDGKKGTTRTARNLHNSSKDFCIGSSTDNVNGFDGFISNFRLVKGTAVYTSDFIPPTRELTNVTNTKLLCCQSNTLAGSAAVTPVTGNTGYTGTSQSITLNQANLNASSSLITVANVVDGSTSTSADLRGAGSFVELIFPQQQNGTLQINVANGNDVNDDDIRVFIDGVEGTAFDVSSQQWITIHTGDFTTVKLEHQGSTTGYIYGFRIGTGGDTIISKSLAPVGNAAPTNFNPFITDINTVRGQETGYATWNPLSVRSSVTFSEGNLTLTNSGSGASGWRNVGCTQSVTSGKWYVEMHTIGSQNGGLMPGVCKLPDDQGTFNPGTFSNNFPGMTANSYALNCFSGSKRTNGSDASYGSGMAAGDLIMTCLDLDNGAIWWGKNGVWFAGGDPAANSNAAFTGLTGEFVFACGISASEKIVTNFGQKSYKYAPPAGFQPLNAANAKPVKVFARPDQFVGVVAYTGDGNSPRGIGGFGFQPDLVVYKERSEARDWQWYDSVRGVGPAKNLVSNTTYAETANDDTQYGYTSSFNKDGFTVTNGTGGGNANIYTNKNGQTYASWTWKAGGSKNTFNVDDVGYANASDVNMSVGSLNSASYDKSVTWSSTSGMSTPANAFDGSFSTGATVSSSGSPITVTTGSFTASSISFYKNGNNDANLATITINDTSVFSFPLQSTATGWVTVNIGSEVTVTSLKTTWYGAYTLYAVKYDTKLLVDNGTTTQNVPSIANTGASVGTKQGFSIVGFTDGGSACNIAHGLTKAPDFYIVKFRGASGNWSIYHKSLGNTKRLKFTDENSGSADAGWWQNTSPTSLVFYLGGNLITSTTQIAYLWHDVPGLQKFGSYVGNGNSDGPFIELGFRPAVIFLKRTDSASSWQVRDTTRSPHNVVTQNLYPNLSNAESTDSSLNLDILSDGFKPRTSTDGGSNANNGTYIYAAWAEAPTVNLFGAQSNAR